VNCSRPKVEIAFDAFIEIADHGIVTCVRVSLLKDERLLSHATTF
jgi:hypothetical protein